MNEGNSSRQESESALVAKMQRERAVTRNPKDSPYLALGVYGAIFGLIWLFATLVSHPQKLVVSDNGEIEGIMNRGRALIQGKGFWAGQLNSAQMELKAEIKRPEREAARERELYESNLAVEKSLRDYDEKAYRIYPERRPSRAQRHAAELRDTADRIEKAENSAFVNRLLEEGRQKRISALQRIIAITQARAR